MQTLDNFGQFVLVSRRQLECRTLKAQSLYLAAVFATLSWRNITQTIITPHANTGVGAPSRGLRAIAAKGAPKTKGFSHQRNIKKILRGIVLISALNAATSPRVPKMISSQVLWGTVSGMLASTAFMMLSDAIEQSVQTCPNNHSVKTRSADPIMTPPK